MIHGGMARNRAQMRLRFSKQFRIQLKDIPLALADAPGKVAGFQVGIGRGFSQQHLCDPLEPSLLFSFHVGLVGIMGNIVRIVPIVPCLLF